MGVDPVACTRFCEQPDLPAVGGTKNPDVEAIVALAPELVIVNDEENRIEDADALEARGDLRNRLHSHFGGNRRHRLPEAHQRLALAARQVLLSTGHEWVLRLRREPLHG